MTPANLRAIRMRLGLSVKECALVLGMTESQVETSERAKTNTVFAHYHEAIAAIESRMQDHIDAVCAQGGSLAVLVGFMSTEDMMRFEPGLAPLRSNQVHRMALAEAQAIIAAEHGPIDIVELIPDRYQKYLDLQGITDCSASRELWAWDRRAQFKLVPVGG